MAACLAILVASLPLKGGGNSTPWDPAHTNS